MNWVTSITLEHYSTLNYGNEVEQDYEQALDYYRKAAEQGYASAQNALGYMFEHGEGVEKDYAHNNYKQAFVWYTKAAEQGYAEAQYNLGVLYETFGSDYLGIEIDRDTGYVEAAKCYKKAAEQGHVHAHYKLRWAYQFGRGVPKNQKKAASLYRKAAAQGDDYANIALNDLGMQEFWDHGVAP